MKIDSELRRDVERELEWDPSIDARNIAVAVKNGVVTLTGHVPTYSDMWRAENIAKRVAGVTALANEIEVKLAGARTDTDIAESAKTALRLDSRVPADNIKVIVSHGRITLEVARAALDMAQVDRFGLDKQDRRYLETLVGVFEGGPTGVEAIAATMNLPSDTLSDEIEPYLLREQFIVRTPRGRQATPKAYLHLGKPPPSAGGAAQGMLFD